MAYDWSDLFKRCQKVARQHKIPDLSHQEVRFGKLLIQTMLKDTSDVNMMVEGDRGTGKSMAGKRIQQIVGIIWTVLGHWEHPDERFTMTFDSDDLVVMTGHIEDLRMGDVFLLEEPQASDLSNKRQLTLKAQQVAGFIQAAREWQLILIVTSASSEELNLVFQKYRTHRLFPPFGKRIRKYIKRGFTSGRAGNISKKARESVWVVQLSTFSPSLGRPLDRYRREWSVGKKKKERKMFLYLRHPGRSWEQKYRVTKRAALAELNRKKLSRIDLDEVSGIQKEELW